MRICFVDHPAHQVTLSSLFLIDELKMIGEVDVYFADIVKIEKLILQLLDTNYDYYVFFQFDHLAYPFISRGKRTIIVPMVDGSGNRGIKHWYRLRGASLLAFSRGIHLFVRGLGFKSVYHQYWPEPFEKQNHDLRQNIIYFWERGIYSNWNINLFLKILKNYKDFRIIIRTDNFKGYGALDKRIEEVTNVGREMHLKLVRQAQMFIAPRPSEGIGFANLEALASGTPVLSLKHQVMTEYLKSNLNGYLIKNPYKTVLPMLNLRAMSNFTYQNAKNNFTISKGKFRSDLELLISDCKPSKVSKHSKTLKLISESVRIHQSDNSGDLFTLGTFLAIHNFFQK